MLLNCKSISYFHVPTVKQSELDHGKNMNFTYFKIFES